MYKLTFYCLLAVWIFALLLSLVGQLSYQPVDLITTFALIFITCLGINSIFAYVFEVPSNKESVYITALILALIISPVKPFSNLNFILLASALAIASKYLIALHKKHIFNPTAFGIAVAALMVKQYAIWWVGTLYMLPIILVIGFLVIRKIQRFDLVISFLLTCFVLSIGYVAVNGRDVILVLKQLIINSPLLFIAFIMLTEPMTTPPKRNLRIMYGILTGALSMPYINIFGFYFTPELALLTGNIFSYIVSPKHRFILSLKEKKQVSYSVCDFIFTKSKEMKFQAGQYMEWTLGHDNQDNRGIRRYFTIASSPTEKDIRIGVKFYPKPSSYKKALDLFKGGETIIASQLAGDFILPEDKQKKLVFLAGGIGVTPFRSMIKYLLDKEEKRDIIMYYANKSFADVAYEDVFSAAKENLKIKTVHVLDSEEGVPNGFNFEKGPITVDMIKKEVPDYKDRIFYISGPKSMVDAFKKALKELGVSRLNIKTDFFPGFV